MALHVCPATPFRNPGHALIFTGLQTMLNTVAVEALFLNINPVTFVAPVVLSGES